MMRLHFTAAAIVAMLLAPHAAAASNFTVTPTEVDLARVLPDRELASVTAGKEGPLATLGA